MERGEGARAEAAAARGRDHILCYINMQSPGNRVRLQPEPVRGPASLFCSPGARSGTFPPSLPADVGLHVRLSSSVHLFSVTLGCLKPLCQTAEVDLASSTVCGEDLTSCWTSSDLLELFIHPDLSVGLHFYFVFGQMFVINVVPPLTSGLDLCHQVTQVFGAELLRVRNGLNSHSLSNCLSVEQSSTKHLWDEIKKQKVVRPVAVCGPTAPSGGHTAALRMH